MKRSILIIIWLLAGVATNAQNPYKITEQTIPYDKMATSFTANIIGQNERNVYYPWQKFIELHKGNTYLVSAKEGNVEFESEHVELPMLGDKPVTLHSRLEPNYAENGVLLTLWIELPNGSYYSSKTHEDSAQKIKDWLLKFDQQLTDNQFRN